MKESPTLQFLEVARTVTGSKHLVRADGRAARRDSFWIVLMHLARSPLFVVALLACRPVFAEFKVGDTVVVIHDTQMRVGDKVLQEVPRGVGLKVQAVKGDWLWVSNVATGWIRQNDVATPTRAIEAFTEQINKDPHDADALVCRALAWCDRGEFDLAIADLNEAIRLDPTNSSAYSSRAICWWSKREVDKGISDCSEAIRLEPHDAMYYANRGILWNMTGEYDKAIADADAAIRLAPALVIAHVVRGNAFTRQHDPAKALAEFNAALDINPRAPTALAMRGRARSNLGAYAQATQDFEAALALDPGNKDVLIELARFFATCPEERFRNGPRAVEYAARACEMSKWSSASAIGVLAAAYAETGEFDKAVEYLAKATEMVPAKRQREYRQRLALYKARKPYRQLPQSVAAEPPAEKTKRDG